MDQWLPNLSESYFRSTPTSVYRVLFSATRKTLENSADPHRTPRSLQNPRRDPCTGLRNFRIESLDLRSRPPFTGVPQGPRPESAPRSVFRVFWAPVSECPEECFLSVFFGVFLPQKKQKKKNTQKALRGALSGPGPWGTPVNGGRDRNLRLQCMCSGFASAATLPLTTFRLSLSLSLSLLLPRQRRQGALSL